jgi:geranylgeranylglycerol-phosphate geranylgeranyltransferase
VFKILGALLYMTRPWNWARVQVPATLVGVFSGLHAARAHYPDPWSAVTANLGAIGWSAVAVATLSAAGYVINDYFDQDIDAVNEPGRAIPSGVVSSRLALIATLVLFAVGLTASYLIGWVNLEIAGLWVVFAVWYAASLKRRGYGLESLAFGIIMGLTTMFGSAAVLHGLGDRVSWLVAAFIALYITALHMTGTLKDLAGDARAGCKTAAIVYGERATRKLIPIVYLLSFLVLLYAAWQTLEMGPVLSVALAAVVVSVMAANISALQANSRRRIVRAHALSKTFIYAIFVILTIHFVT